MKQLSKEQREILIKTANYMIDRSDTSDYSENIRQVAMLALSCLDQEPVGRVIDAGDALMVEWLRNLGEGDTLYAAPPAPVLPDAWIPCSERMPENGGAFQVWDGKHIGCVSFLFGSFQCLFPDQITHWQPLPAPPKDKK